MLISFVAPLAASFAILQFQKYQIKKNVKERIIAQMDVEELVLLKFSDDEKQTLLFWENSKEFEFKDQMYDVVKTEVKNGITYYYCWPDDQETKLNKQLDELVAFTVGNNPNHNNDQKNLSLFLKSLYFSKYIQENFIVYSETTNSFLFHPKDYQSQIHSPTDPPPKIS